MSFWTRFFTGPERGTLGKVDSRLWTGLRISTVGGVAALVGAGAVGLGAEFIGKIILIAGIGAVCIGAGIHLVMLVRHLSGK
jgi:hypothetical protein